MAETWVATRSVPGGTVPPCSRRGRRRLRRWMRCWSGSPTPTRRPATPSRGSPPRARLIKGIGPRMAERIVDDFGQATLQVIEQEPGRLVEVAGLGPKRTGMITAAWEEQRAIKEVMVFLQRVG